MTEAQEFLKGQGLFRYAVNLVRGLSGIDQDEFEFVLFGSHEDPGDELKDIIQSRSDRWRYIPIRPWRFKGSYYADYLRYACIAFTHHIRIWHTLHSFIPGLATCRIVLTKYDLMYELFDEYKEAVCSTPYRIEKWLTQHRVDHIIAVSQTTANDLKNKWRIPDGKISVSYPGTDFLEIGTSADNPRAVRLLKENSGPTLLSPFNLEPRKNLQSLLMAMPVLLRDYPNLQLILFGKAAWTPDREAAFQTMLQELGIEQNVICTGFLSDEELAAYYEETTIFVFPSLYEGFGFPVLEAMARGACVVARGTSSMAETLGESGAYVEQCKPQELATAIIALLSDTPKRKQLGKIARERAKLFNIESMASKTYELYRSTLGRK